MRVSYLDAALLNLPECEGVDGFDCSDPAIVFNVDARCYFCGPHHRFWEKHYQSDDPYEFGQLSETSYPWPQTLVEYVCEYMQKRGL